MLLKNVALPLRLGLLVAGTALPLILFAAVLVYVNHTEKREGAHDLVLQIVRSTRLVLDSETERITAGLQVLAISESLQRDDLERFRHNANAFVEQFPPGSVLVLGNRAGQQVLNTGIAAGTPLFAQTARPDREEPFRTGRPAYSALFAAPLTGERAIAIAVPVFRGSEIVYDLSFSPPLGHFQSIIAKQRPSADWTISFFDRNGLNFARMPNPEETIGQRASPSLFAELFKDREMKLRTVSLENVPLLTAYSHSDISGWVVAAGVAEATLTAPLMRQLALTIAIGVVLLLLSLGFALRLATRLARAERMQKLLVDELNHRVKNTLTTVQSLASQTFRNAPDLPEALRKFQARLVAMARAHGLLTQEKWQNAELGEVVESVLEPFRAREKQRVHASGPPVRLAPQTALIMSMALHELATNAAKYGALSNDRGEVFIDWAGVEKNGKPLVRLIWRENGGPPVEADPARKGFGSTLIQKALAGQLGGSARLEFRTDGVVCTLECPIG